MGTFQKVYLSRENTNNILDLKTFREQKKYSYQESMQDKGSRIKKLFL